MEPVSRELLGEPAEHDKRKRELRWGTRGSMCVNLDKGAWHDREANRGGGVLDLIQWKAGLDKPEAVAWMRERGHLQDQPPPADKSKPRPKFVHAYDYTDAAGTLLFQVVRYEPKDFRQRRPGEREGQWIHNMDGVERVPYRLPQLLAAIPLRRGGLCGGRGEGVRRPCGAGAGGDVLARRRDEVAGGVSPVVRRRRRGAAAGRGRAGPLARRRRRRCASGPRPHGAHAGAAQPPREGRSGRLDRGGRDRGRP